MLEDEGLWKALRDESHEEAYILGRTISSIELFKRGRRNINRIYRSKDLFSEEAKECFLIVRKYMFSDPYSADLEIFLMKYPGLDSERLAKRICAESEYRYF